MNQQLQSNLLDTKQAEEIIKSIEFKYFGCTYSLFWRVFIWFVNFFTLGLAEAILLLPNTKHLIRKLIIGGRKLNFDTKDPYFKIPILCIVHNTINLFTFGLWQLLGMKQRFLYSELDKRISWGEIAQPHQNRLVWFPNNDGKGQFKIITASHGLVATIVIYVARIFSSIFLGLGEPWIIAYQYSKLFPAIKLGGTGQFQFSAQPPQFEGHDSLSLTFKASGFDIFFSLWIGQLVSIFSCGLFICCFTSWYYSFLNKFIRPNEKSAAYSLGRFRGGEELQVPNNYYYAKK